MLKHTLIGNSSDNRNRVLKAAKLAGPGGKLLIDVIIRSMSMTEALLTIPATVDMPTNFDLLIPSEGLRYPSRLVALHANEMMVQFTGHPSPINFVPQVSTPHPVATESPAPTVSAPRDFDKYQIQPVFTLGYDQHPLHSTRGHVSINVALLNKGSIDAHQPFLCIPSLGLRVEPASGWVMQEVKSVRKMHRFSRIEAFDLVPGSSQHCCTIILPFSMESGGELEYEAGNRHTLRALPDLRLTCVAGSGNYPSERLPLTIHAGEMAAHFARLLSEGQIPPVARADSTASTDHGLPLLH